MNELEHLMNREAITVNAEKFMVGDQLQNVQICPVGDWKNGEKMQHCTVEALQNVVADWKAQGGKDILCDFEHNSEAGGTSDTTAAAWITNLNVDPERGLTGDFIFTDKGAEAIANRRLRFLSVAWLVNKETREPMHILSVALTNKPNIPVDPILNKEDEETTKPVEDLKEKSMEKIKEALGLPPEASDEDILNAIGGLVQKNKEAEEAAKAAEREKLEDEAEKFAECNKAKLDKAVIKAQYLANKEACVALVNAIPAPKVAEPAQKLLNKGTGAEMVKNRASREAMAALPPAQRAAYYKEHAAEIDG